MRMPFFVTMSENEKSRIRKNHEYFREAALKKAKAIEEKKKLSKQDT